MSNDDILKLEVNFAVVTPDTFKVHVLNAVLFDDPKSIVIMRTIELAVQDCVETYGKDHSPRCVHCNQPFDEKTKVPAVWGIAYGKIPVGVRTPRIGRIAACDDADASDDIEHERDFSLALGMCAKCAAENIATKGGKFDGVFIEAFNKAMGGASALVNPGPEADAKLAEMTERAEAIKAGRS